MVISVASISDSSLMMSDGGKGHSISRDVQVPVVRQETSTISFAGFRGHSQARHESADFTLKFQFRGKEKDNVSYAVSRAHSVEYTTRALPGRGERV